ncbi:g1814 [Coccomyxa elongata]
MNLHVNLSYSVVMGGLLNVLQAELKADRARLKRVEGTLSAMRSLSDAKANTEEYKAKIKHLKEQLELAEERADAEHQLAEIRRQEANILKRALHLRDEDMAAGCHRKPHDQLADCTLQSIAQIQRLHFTDDEIHLDSQVTDEMHEIHLPSKGTSVAMNEGDSRKCEALQSQISCLIKECDRLKESLATCTKDLDSSKQAYDTLLSDNFQLQEILSDLIQEKEETSRELVERMQRYAEKMEAAGTAFQHELQEHASKSQVHVREMTHMKSSGLQEIMSLA